MTLELNDIQHFLLTRPRALAARYGFLRFRQPDHGRAWLAGIVDRVGRGRGLDSGGTVDSRWVTVAFTWNGLRVLGVDDASLSTFPEEFRQGMTERAAILGDTGANHPDRWVGGLASPDLHALVILFARDVPERERCVQEHQQYAAQFPGVEALSTLDLEATPPLDYAHDHFGYRDRMSQPEIEGMGVEPTPGTGAPLKPGEFFLGYPDENGDIGPLPQPEILSRNGSFLAYRRMEEHVGAFRDFLRANAATPDEQELIAAKLMGRWRSGAPLVLAPTKDDPQLAADPQRNNNFDYGKMDPHGYAVPLGSHIRRMNPRDTAVNINRRRIIRRGGTYGPPLPEGAAEDGVERGIAAFVGCASLIRQYEFAQNVWANDPRFHELGNERDPFIGTHDSGAPFSRQRRRDDIRVDRLGPTRGIANTMSLTELLIKGASVVAFVVSSTLSVGLGLTVRQILEPLSNGRLVVLSLLANFVLAPAIAIGLTRLLGLEEPLGIGLLLVGLAGGAPFLLKLADLAKADMPFAVGLMVVLMVITVGYMPIVLPLLLQGASVNPGSIARSLILLMLIPLALGLALRAWHPPGAARVRAFVAPVSSVSMVCVVVLTTAGHFGSMLSILGSLGIVSAAIFVVICCAIGWMLGGPATDTRGVLSLGTAQRNTAAALVVAGQNFSDAKVVVMITVVMIVSFAVLMPLAGALAKRQQPRDVGSGAAATR